MSDNLGNYFNSDDLTGTYKCKVIAKYFDTTKASRIVPEFDGKPTTASWLSVKFECIEEDSDQYGFEFPQGGGFTGEMFEYFPWLKGNDALKKLTPEQRKKMQEAYDKRLRRLRSLEVPEAELNTVKASDIDGMIVEIEVKTSTSSKDGVTKYHNVNKVKPVHDDGDEDYSLLDEDL